MKTLGEKITKAATIFAVLLALVLTGCASTQTGKATRDYGEDYRFVPRIHVEDDSFGGSSEYNQCSFDLYYDGYWCRVN